MVGEWPQTEQDSRRDIVMVSLRPDNSDELRCGQHEGDEEEFVNLSTRALLGIVADRIMKATSRIRPSSSPDGDIDK